MTDKLRIDEMYAYVAESDEGEGVCSIHSERLGNMPMVGADRERMLSLRPYAQELAAAMGVPVKLVRFSKREVIEELTSRGASAMN